MCCALLIFIIATLRRFYWQTLLCENENSINKRLLTPLPPPARRSVLGEPIQASIKVATIQQPEIILHESSPFWLGFIVGTICFVAIIFLLTLFGFTWDASAQLGTWCFSIEPEKWRTSWIEIPSAQRWMTRYGIFSALIIFSAAKLIQSARQKLDHSTPPHVRQGKFIVGIGIAWLLCGILDQHLFSLYLLLIGNIIVDQHWLQHTLGIVISLYGLLHINQDKTILLPTTLRINS